jgi:hypothetical protein
MARKWAHLEAVARRRFGGRAGPGDFVEGFAAGNMRKPGNLRRAFCRWCAPMAAGRGVPFADYGFWIVWM